MNELDISTQITLYGHHLQARFCKSLDLFLRCWQKVPHITTDKILSKEHFSKKKTKVANEGLQLKDFLIEGVFFFGLLQ